MKRHKRLVGLIKRQSKDGEQGSIVLEAALVMPLLLIVLLLFIVMIRLSAVQMALQSTASQTVRQIAANIHPVDLAFQQVSAHIPDFEPENMPMSNWTGIAATAAEWLPDPTGAVASAVLSGDWQPFVDVASTELGRFAVEPLLQQFADEAVIEKERVKLSRLTLPDLKDKQEPYLMIEAEYEFPLKIPFLKKRILLREQASERVWVSDAVPSQASGGEGAETIPLQIVSIEPTPLFRGNKATVVARTSPGASLSLEVMYKSGQSQAKHLGKAVADENGFVSWTWLVSGNTTPGLWELTAEAASGEKVSMHFNVVKKE